MSVLLTFDDEAEDRFLAEYTKRVAALNLFYDPEGRSDAELVEEYVQSKSPGTLAQILAEGQRFLSQSQLPMRLIATNANRYLVTEAEQRQWLQILLDRVQAELDAREAGTRVKHI